MTKAKERKNGTRIVCSCGQVLGENIVGLGYLVIRHGGRETVIRETAAVLAITCERCGRVWRDDVIDKQPG